MEAKKISNFKMGLALLGAILLFVISGCQFFDSDVSWEKYQEADAEAERLYAEGKFEEATEKFVESLKYDPSPYMMYSIDSCLYETGKPAIPHLATLLEVDDGDLTFQALGWMDELGVDWDEYTPQLIDYIEKGRELMFLRLTKRYKKSEGDYDLPSWPIGYLLYVMFDSTLGDLLKEMEDGKRFGGRLVAATKLAKCQNGRKVLESYINSSDEYRKEVAAFGLDMPWSKYRTLFILRGMTYLPPSSLGGVSGMNLEQLRAREDYIVSHTYGKRKDAAGDYGETFVMGDPSREIELMNIASQKTRIYNGGEPSPVFWQSSSSIKGSLDARAFPAQVKILTDDTLYFWHHRVNAGNMIMTLGIPPGYKSDEDIKRLEAFLKRKDTNYNAHYILKGYAVYALKLLGYTGKLPEIPAKKFSKKVIEREAYLETRGWKSEELEKYD